MNRISSRMVWASAAVIVLLLAWPMVVGAAPPEYGPVVHVVQWGENLTGIAARYGVTVDAIVAANNIANPNRIYVGQRLIIPIPPGPTETPANAIRHIVQSGDTLSSLAVRYRTTVDAIVQLNKLVNPSYIYVGQVLLIPGETGTLPAEGFYYTVRSGDTLANIACRYGVSSWTLAQINNLTNPSLIVVGQTLYIPGVQDAPTPTPAGPTATPTPTKMPGTSAPTATPTPTKAASAVTATPVGSCTPPPIAGTPTPQPCILPTMTAIPLGAVPLPSPGPVKPLQMSSPEYGMIVNVWKAGDCITDRDLRLVKQAGFTWVKQVFPWRDIEIGKGKFDWAEADRVVGMVAKYNLDLAIAISLQPEWAADGYPLNNPPRNMADIADFMAAIAKRYKGLVRAYEIWPGPNVSQNWGGQSPNPQRYAEMLRNAYWYTKQQDPNAMIISGGLVQTAQWDWSSIPPREFLRILYEETQAPFVCDVWGVEALGFKAAPENSPDELANGDLNNYYPATRELNTTWGFRSVEVLHDYTLAPERQIRKQWVVTKMGWTTDTRERSLVKWAAVSEQVQGDYLRRA
ncbi:MAG: LysM peptidoglycan-binding domain-containing protein, partial [Anaerolineae bacterium]|nr:LysM peptidoglycan-binding domain-containing protein [Anaerolineae bacterium]